MLKDYRQELPDDVQAQALTEFQRRPKIYVLHFCLTLASAVEVVDTAKILGLAYLLVMTAIPQP
jgi:hypothetical protein